MQDLSEKIKGIIKIFGGNATLGDIYKELRKDEL